MTISPSRRALLAGAAVALVTGCSGGSGDGDSGDETPAATATPRRSPVPTDLSAGVAGQFAALERRYDARLGVHAWDSGTGAALGTRADERFPMCSTFKALAAAAVQQKNDDRRMNDPVALSLTPDERAAVLSVVRPARSDGITLFDLCAAAVRSSDNTAGNLLLREIGGPAGLTRFLRTIGDDVTRLDRVEPDLSAATPGDPRDTTTPRAYAADLRRLVVDTSGNDADAIWLMTWMEEATTGARRIRAAAPSGWRVADKTGTGSYGTANDVALLFPPDRPRDPIVLTVFTTRPSVGPRARGAHREELVADATRVALGALGIT